MQNAGSINKILVHFNEPAVQNKLSGPLVCDIFEKQNALNFMNHFNDTQRKRKEEKKKRKNCTEGKSATVILIYSVRNK